MKKSIKNGFKLLTALLLAFAALLGTVGCGEEKLVEKTELWLNFVIPEDFVRSYEQDANIEYKGEDSAFLVDLKQYSDCKLEYGASIKQCTEAIIDEMELGGTNINYNAEKQTAQFDTWATDKEGLESYYSYIVILAAQNGIYIARYVCAGTDSEIKKHSPSFAKMAEHLSVEQP